MKFTEVLFLIAKIKTIHMSTSDEWINKYEGSVKYNIIQHKKY